MRHREGDDDDDDELDEREMPAEADVDHVEDEDATDTEPCPYCHKPVYAEADVCPHCGNFISAADVPRARRPVWIVVGVVLCLLVVLAWVLSGS